MKVMPYQVATGMFKKEILEAFEEVLDSGMFVLGNKTRQFEKEFASSHGRNFGIAVNSDTAALEAALNLLRKEGLAEDATVLMPDTAFFGCANVALRLGHKVCPVPVTVNNGIMPTLEQLKQTVERLERRDPNLTQHMVYMAVYTAGTVGADAREVLHWCGYQGIPVIEDCAHCMSPDTNILMPDMTWCKLGELKPGDKIAGFDENAEGQRSRRLEVSTVIEADRIDLPCLKIETTDASFVCSTDHQWLVKTNAGVVWRRADRLKLDEEIVTFCRPKAAVDFLSERYQSGYICGVSVGDGTIGKAIDKRDGKERWQWRLRLNDREPVWRCGAYLSEKGIDFSMRVKSGRYDISVGDEFCGHMLQMLADADSENYNWAAGFVAGFFDAEGWFSLAGGKSTTLAVCNRQEQYLSLFENACRRLGFKTGRCPHFDGGFAGSKNDMQDILLRGDINEKLSFLSMVQPAIARKFKVLWGRSLYYKSSFVEEIEEVGEREVVMLKTSSSTFIADGAAAHNCHGATYSDGLLVGSHGDIATFSFYATKMIHSGEGGMVFVDTAKRSEFLRLYRDYGKDYTDPVFADVKEIGYNWRMTEFQAALGSILWKNYGWIYNNRKAIEEVYDQYFSLIRTLGTSLRIRRLQVVNRQLTPNLYRYIILVDGLESREQNYALYEYLRGFDIGLQAKCNSKPLTEMQVFQKHPLFINLPAVSTAAYDYCMQHLCLPIYPTLDPAAAEYVAEKVIEAVDYVC